MDEADLESLPLIDHHCHGVVRSGLDRHRFEEVLTEGDGAGPLGGTLFDSQIGLAVRRWCAPVLGLPARASAEDYLERRAALDTDEVNRRFLRVAGIEAMCVDTGVAGDLLSPADLAERANARAYEIVRLETVAEQVAAGGTTATGFAEAFRARLAGRARDAIGFKSIAAYRAGLDLRGERPSDAEVAVAAGRWLATPGSAHDHAGTVRPQAPDGPDGHAGRGEAAGSGGSLSLSAAPRLADETLHRFLIWSAVEHGLPIQFHVGYGDTDADLRRAGPLLLTDLLRELAPTGTPVMLLHNYPFHREAGYLAQVFPNVFADVGLAAHNAGRRAGVLLAELLELAPFGKVLFSSDAYALPELFHLAAVLFRRALAQVLGEGVSDGTWTGADARRVARLIASENARRVYGLPAA